MTKTTSRRRFLGIMAASASLLGSGTLYAGARASSASQLEPARWSGVALGADAQIQLLHPDPAQAQRLLRLAIAEIQRLERIFSLYRPDSLLVALNTHGELARPPADMLRLLQRAQEYAALTAGYFDPSVQVLWQFYAQRIAAGNTARASAAELQDVLARVDYRAIELDPARIRLAKPGMALTLNGIAQGFISDKVCELLQENGLEHALVDLGEARAFGRNAEQQIWRAGIAAPNDPTQILATLSLENQALATSGGYGTLLAAQSALTHIFDPHTGSATPSWRSVSVRAPDATGADALSTAFGNMPAASIRSIASQTATEVWLLPPKGTELLHIA